MEDKAKAKTPYPASARPATPPPPPEPEPNDVCKIGVIYDTSYLMKGLFLEVGDVVAGRLIEFHHFVPNEVLGELRNHLADPEKQQQAKGARGIIAKMIDICANQKYINSYSEPELTKIVVPPSDRSPLGADSPVDMMLVEYAKFLIRDSGYLASVVATADGGIAYDISKIRLIENIKIFYIDNDKLSSCVGLMAIVNQPCHLKRKTDSGWGASGRRY